MLYAVVTLKTTEVQEKIKNPLEHSPCCNIHHTMIYCSAAWYHRHSMPVFSQHSPNSQNLSSACGTALSASQTTTLGMHSAQGTLCAWCSKQLLCLLCGLKHLPQHQTHSLTTGMCPPVWPQQTREGLTEDQLQLSCWPWQHPGAGAERLCSPALWGAKRCFKHFFLPGSCSNWIKSATIIPIAKSSTVTCLNDYQSVVFIPIVMKSFERLILAYIKDSIDVTVDPHQYAHWRNWLNMNNPILSVVWPSSTWRARTFLRGLHIRL